MRKRGMRRQIFKAMFFAIALTAASLAGVVHLVGGWSDGLSTPRKVLIVGVPLMVLWALAGLWARRMTHPLAMLAATARELGEGRLDARVRLGWHDGGEIGALALAMNTMAERLEAKLRAERELLATVSHELRSPLARVRLLCELGSEKRREVLPEIEREAQAMDALVGDLLAAARLDGGAAAPRPLELGLLVREAIARHAELSGAPPVELALDPACPTTIEGDATLLSRALATLLDNARRHAGGATRLTITATRPGIALAVEDRGPGIADDDRGRIFEPFQRGGGRAPDEKYGVGLGLYLVRRIAEAHHGHAFAEPLEGGGERIGFTVVPA
jgi:signal transduction histidine kinase